MSSYRRKLVIVGDSNVGKTSLLNRFAHGRDYENYIPTVFESWVADLPIGQDTVELAFWDTSAGHEDYERLRPLSYPHTHVTIIAFSVDSRESFNNVSAKWFPEVRRYLPRSIPIVLVCCKKDVREDENALKEFAKVRRQPVSSDEGMASAAKNNATKYLECSAKTGEGVSEVFDASARAALKIRADQPQNSGCSCVIC
ncbi:P-loop containing nucleoside triphosphate hydrolase protein [Flagelloscypha sp. PMI_526]|nr:P-loop containing nucleoside triphosphate hydrolase protein [Flagelloscypha sp. PMI_526]